MQFSNADVGNGFALSNAGPIGQSFEGFLLFDPSSGATSGVQLIPGSPSSFSVAIDGTAVPSPAGLMVLLSAALMRRRRQC